MENVFLVCFLFGALFALLSVVLGFLGGTFHATGHVAHLPHLPHGHAGGHPAATRQGAHPPAGESDSLPAHLPVFNASALLAFLAWFGAAGYLLTRFSGWPLVLILPLAILAGLAAALIVGAILGAVLRGERVMRPEDYRLDGTPARVTVRIPAGGVGEIVFTKAGARRGEAARSLDGGEIPRDAEVVIIDYTGGIALVETLEQLLSRPEPPRLTGSERKDS